MSSPKHCPYVGCSTPLQPALAEICGCDHLQPLIVCAACSYPNRVGACYCRACGGDLSSQSVADPISLRLGNIGRSCIPGHFRRPPAFANGFLYAFSRDGVVYQMSTLAGAKAREIARVQLNSAGYNRMALVKVSGKQMALRGWTLLAVGTDGIEAVHLSSGKCTKLFGPNAGEELAVNQSEADSTGFKGVAATGEFCAFIVKMNSHENTLAIKYLGQDRPVDLPLTLAGTNVAGPALYGKQIVLCTDQQVGVYHCDTGKTSMMELPRGFTPLLTPSSDEMTISAGGMPFAVTTSDSGDRLVCVAGSQRGKSGLLLVDFDRGVSTFRTLPRGCSLTLGSSGSTCLRTPDGIEVLAPGETQTTDLRTQPGMPVFFDSTYICSFGEVDFAGDHRLNVAHGGRRIELRFQEIRCDKYSCCTVLVLDRQIIIGFLDIFANEQDNGMNFVHCTLVDESSGPVFASVSAD